MSESLLDIKNNDYVFRPVAYHDSWLSIDPIIGCRLNCQYCYMRSTNWTGVRPEYLYTVTEIVEMIIAHRYFLPHETVLCFGNQTDSFLPENVDYTLEFFEALEKRGLNNPVAVVTKKRIPSRFLDRIRQLKNVRPIFCLSYSGLPRELERGVNPQENRDNFKELSKLGLRVIHFWRPLIAENGSTQVIEQVLDFVAAHAMASVYIGLKLSPMLYKVYDQNQYLRLAEDLKLQCGDYLPDEIEARIRTLAAAKYPGYPLYKHTSCAISYVLSLPDYTATVYRESICKGSSCPEWKRRICEGARTIPTYQQVQAFLSRLGLENDFAISKLAIEISGEISQENYAFLLHRLNYPIKAQVTFSRNVWGSIFANSEASPHKGTN